MYLKGCRTVDFVQLTDKNKWPLRKNSFSGHCIFKVSSVKAHTRAGFKVVKVDQEQKTVDKTKDFIYSGMFFDLKANPSVSDTLIDQSPLVADHAPTGFTLLTLLKINGLK